MNKRDRKEKQRYLATKRVDANPEDTKQDALKEALRTNTRIPHHLRDQAKAILDDMVYNSNTGDAAEEEATVQLPRVVVTTSHGPSSTLKAFAKHLSLIFSGQNLLRGKMSLEELNDYCRRSSTTHLIILNETKGNPTTLILCRYPYGPTYRFSLFRLKFHRRQRTFGEKAYLVIDGMSSELGSKLKRSLSLCFPSVKDASRLVALINRNGTIAFRHFLIENRKLLSECEFDLRLFKVVGSTIESEGTVDYVLNAFTNTRKDDVLSAEAD